MRSHKQIEIGWEEWIALPELNLPAIRAKVDTGAKTSALHAFKVEKFFEDDIEKIRFGIHPVPDRPDIEVYSTAQLIDEREIISSNGQSERRYVIRTVAQFGKEKWPIEITLTNRETMNYRMLIGRSAMKGRVRVVPEESFLLGNLSIELYESIQTKRHKRNLKICLLSNHPNHYTTSRIAAVAEARGHDVDIINPVKCYATIGSNEPRIHYNNRVLPTYDVVIPRFNASIATYGLAILRQFELLGTYCFNASDSITKVQDKLYAYQLLNRRQIKMPKAVFCYNPSNADDINQLLKGKPFMLKALQDGAHTEPVLIQNEAAADTAIKILKQLKSHFLLQSHYDGELIQSIQCIVLGDKILTSVEIVTETSNVIAKKAKHKKTQNIRLTLHERKIVLKAAKLFRLKFAQIDIIRLGEQCLLVDIESSPGIKNIEMLSRKDVALSMIDYLEHHAMPVAFPS